MYKVSVIIPVYKTEPYLRDCLDSVVNQTLKDIEIICVDDGSPDNSAAIAAEYVQRYDNIKLVRQENGGLSTARNAGLDVAAGEYICFLDSDDTLEDRALEKLYGTAAEENLDILYFNTRTVFQNEQMRQNNPHVEGYYDRPGDYCGICTGQQMLARMHKDGKYLASVCLQLLRRGFLEESGIRFFPGIIHEDNLFTFQCAMTARRTNYIPDRLHLRLVREDSITISRVTMRHLEGYLVCCYEALKFLQSVPVQEDAAAGITDYLYEDLWRKACDRWGWMSREEREKPLCCGIPAVEQLLYTVKKEAAAKEELQRQSTRLCAQLEKNDKRIQKVAGDLREAKAEIRKLQKENQKLQDRGLRGFFRTASSHGLVYALRQSVWKCRAALRNIRRR